MALRAVPVAEPVASGAAVGDEVAVASGGIVVSDDGDRRRRLADGVPSRCLRTWPPVAQASATVDVTLLLEPSPPSGRVAADDFWAGFVSP